MGFCLRSQFQRCLLILSLLWVSVSLAADGESQRSAKIVFIRTDSFTAAYWPMVIRVDQRRVATLPRSSYSIVDVKPGERAIQVFCAQRCAMRTLKVKTVIAAGETQYWVVDPEYKKERGFRILISKMYRTDSDEFERISPVPVRVDPD